MTRTERKRREHIATQNHLNRVAASLEVFSDLKVKRTARGFSVSQLTEKEPKKD